MKAYRIESRDGNISFAGNKVKIKIDERYPVSISFVSDEHALYYFRKHHENTVWKEWEMKDSLLDIIKESRTSHSCKLSKPSEADGDVSKQMKSFALSFGKDWEETLNKHIANGSKLIIKEYNEVFDESDPHMIIYVQDTKNYSYSAIQQKDFDSNSQRLISEEEFKNLDITLDDIYTE